MKNKIIISRRLTEQQLSEISLLKATRWVKYSATEHRLWLMENSNLKDDHLLIYEKEILVAYAQLKRNIHIQNMETPIPLIGVGNVCTVESGKGYGWLLLNEINNFILGIESNGILFTTIEKAGFYRKGGWQIIELNIAKGNDSTIAMILSNEKVNFTNDNWFLDELF